MLRKLTEGRSHFSSPVDTHLSRYPYSPIVLYFSLKNPDKDICFIFWGLLLLFTVVSVVICTPVLSGTEWEGAEVLVSNKQRRFAGGGSLVALAGRFVNIAALSVAYLATSGLLRLADDFSWSFPCLFKVLEVANPLSFWMASACFLFAAFLSSLSLQACLIFLVRFFFTGSFCGSFLEKYATADWFEAWRPYLTV